MSSIEQKIDLLTEKFTIFSEAVIGKFSEIDAKFEQIDSRFEQIDKRFEQIEHRLDKMDARFEKMERRMDRFESSLNETNQIVHHILEFRHKVQKCNAFLKNFIKNCFIWSNRRSK